LDVAGATDGTADVASRAELVSWTHGALAGAVLSHVARPRSEAALGALRLHPGIGGARVGIPGAHLGRIAGAHGRPALGRDGAVRAGGAVVAEAVAECGVLASLRRRAALRGALPVVGAVVAVPRARLGNVAGALRRAACDGRARVGAVGARAGVAEGVIFAGASGIAALDGGRFVGLVGAGSSSAVAHGSILAVGGGRALCATRHAARARTRAAAARAIAGGFATQRGSGTCHRRGFEAIGWTGGGRTGALGVDIAVPGRSAARDAGVRQDVGGARGGIASAAIARFLWVTGARGCTADEACFVWITTARGAGAIAHGVGLAGP
jgi:hypothetical protein